VRLALKVVMQIDRDFVDVILLYPLWVDAYKKPIKWRNLKMQKRRM